MSLRDAARNALDGFDAKKDKVNKFQGLPSGEYTVILSDVRRADTPWGTEQLTIVTEVMEGEHVGEKDFNNVGLDEVTAKGNPNPMLSNNIRLIEKLAVCVGLSPTDDDWEDYQTLADMFQPAIGKQVIMDLKIRENKKNPQYPYKNYDFDMTEQQVNEPIEISDDDMPF